MSEELLRAVGEKLCLTWGSDKLMDARKKAVTSALRRFLPNGQSNEIGFSINLRALRHYVMLRSSRHAEWEIRVVTDKVYKLVKDRYPLIFHGAEETMVQGLLEISGMKMQPYEIQIGSPEALRYYEVSALEAEMARRINK